MTGKTARKKQKTANIYHAHVYYNPKTKRQASRLRSEAVKKFKITDRSRNFKLSRWNDKPGGPHPRPHFFIWFKASQYGALVPWLSMNRKGLDILVHSVLENGDPVIEHTNYAVWLGKPFKLRLDNFSGSPPSALGLTRGF
jgi:aromatic ring-cleaving dioxygenase